MPVFPGTKSTYFTKTGNLKTDGFRELFLKLQSHAGTHIDAPSHILEKGKSLSDFEPSQFCGTAFAMPHSKDNPITKVNIQNNIDKLKKVDFLLLYSGWDQYWGESKYFEDYPVPSKSVMKSISELNLKGIGIDSSSLDPIENSDLPNHNLILSKDIIIIENLTNLSSLVHKTFEFFCFPLHITKGDGSPVRAIARLME